MQAWRGVQSSVVTALSLILALYGSTAPLQAARPDDTAAVERPIPQPKPATRPVKSAPVQAAPKAPNNNTNPAQSQADRLKRLNAVKSWGYQLAGLSPSEASRSPFDLLVVDATMGLEPGRAFKPADVQQLKLKPDGSRRLVISYLSVGEAEDYRADYFSPEYLSEDPPEWLGPENPNWQGNRIIHFCHEGWQRTILGDDAGRSVYNSIDPSPLYRLIEQGFDGIYLDRVDVYAEVKKECPDAERKMVDFVARIAAHARKRDPNFIVILQNAEELVRHARLLDSIDAIAKEDLFYGADHSQNLNPQATIAGSLAHLKTARNAGRPVFVVDYVNASEKKADAKKRIEQQGFIPYLAPRNLGKLWLPGKDF